MENKFLQVRKESILKKIFNFIQNIFNKKGTVIEENNNKNVNDNIKDTFIKQIKINNESNSEISKLQKKFENNEITLDSMSDEEVHNLNLLYKEQISNLNKKLDEKKSELKILKNKSNNV